jgi:hypothetical protein
MSPFYRDRYTCTSDLREKILQQDLPECRGGKIFFLLKGEEI